MSTAVQNYDAVRFPARNTQIDGDLWELGNTNLPRVLSAMWGNGATLRPGQDRIITSVMCRRDTIGILPTSVGKSATFIIPTMALGWRTLIFSPLVALMRDQVDKLHKFGFPARQMSSTQTPGENVDAARMWMAGQLNFFYVAPERRRHPWFINAMKAVPPDMIVVDEAHCISDWADDFREDYTHIGEFIRDNPPKVVLALTATCTPAIESDIRRVLSMANANRVVHYVERTNLRLHSREMRDPYDIVDYLKLHTGDGSGLVYCSTRDRTMETAQFLSMALNQEVGVYHGGLTPAQKRTMQDMFMTGRQKIIVATNAFGMGVDKDDIRALIHRDMPGTVESLAQEVGRAGRDWKESQCMTFFSEEGLRTQRFFLSTKYPSSTAIKKVFAGLARLKQGDGLIKSTYKEISEAANENIGVVTTVLKNLLAASVIGRDKPASAFHLVKFLGPEPATSDAQFVRFHELKGIIERLGVPDDKGVFMVDDEALESEVSVTRPTLAKWFKTLVEFGFIFHEPPFRGSELRLLGGLERVDFARLAARAELGHQKLDHALKYINVVPDENKHAFLRQYFEIAIG